MFSNECDGEETREQQELREKVSDGRGRKSREGKQRGNLNSLVNKLSSSYFYARSASH